MTVVRWQGWRAAAAAMVAAAVMFPDAAPAAAESPFAALSGSWTGAGQARFSGGSSEALKCKAYYTPKDAGSSMGLAIRCASPSTQINLRATLNYVSGKISGLWEERTFNASGEVAGQASTGKLSMSIVGGGFSGFMSVGTTGTNQSVVIQTEGIGLRSVNINLSRG